MSTKRTQGLRPQTHRILRVDRPSGSYFYTVPTGARCTIYAGKVQRSGEDASPFNRAVLPLGGQMRIYLGTRLIGFIPDVLEFFEVESVAVQNRGEVSLSQAEQNERAKEEVARAMASYSEDSTLQTIANVGHTYAQSLKGLVK